MSPFQPLANCATKLVHMTEVVSEAVASSWQQLDVSKHLDPPIASMKDKIVARLKCD
jgi:hypothetical protein